MTQSRLKLVTKSKNISHVPEFCEAVGLSSENEVVTLRFMHSPGWGGRTKQISLDRTVAEQLIRLLNDELDDSTWALDY
jgi:hypothetical protein